MSTENIDFGNDGTNRFKKRPLLSIGKEYQRALTTKLSVNINETRFPRKGKKKPPQLSGCRGLNRRIIRGA